MAGVPAEYRTIASYLLTGKIKTKVREDAQLVSETKRADNNIPLSLKKTGACRTSRDTKLRCA